ncbi:phage tail sheath protein [Thermus aquaticus Y51MC23]|uniref:Phage tail sheath protein n=1 Tax=Thermus aquaticus (strain ATCC BAA-2747 / Y51MC23) TaxID=498848 RepID=A0ABN4IF97_THEA5|nr:phage tail sheath protein [Thermus aquaticus Y51MC23]
MANLPGVTINVQDGNLGVLPALGEGVHVKIGVASQGPVNEVVAVSDTKRAKEIFKSGPLLEAIGVAIAQGAGAIYAVRVNASVAGTVSSVTKAGSGTGTLTVTGNPLDAYEVVVRITRTGARGTAAFVYSLDGGDNWSPEIAVPSGGTYTLPGTGLTLTFTNGATEPSFVQGGEFRFTTTAPGYSLTDLNAAIDALFGQAQLRYQFVHVVGAATPTVAAAVDARMGEAASQHRYIWAILDAEDKSDNQLRSDWASFASTRVGVGAGYAEIASPITGRVHRRPISWLWAGRRAARPAQEDVGRVASGPLVGVVKLHRDEYVSPGLDEARFTTARTYPAYAGYYLTQGRLMAPPGSDFELDQYRSVMDLACTVAYQAGLRFVNESIRVDPATGGIAEKDAVRVEGYIAGMLRAALKGKVSEIEGQPAVRVTVDRTENILSSRRLPVSIAVIPLGYAKFISVEIGFENPALKVG